MSLRRYGVLLIAVLAFTFGAALFSTGVAGQDEGWRITRADYGFRDLRNDVTDILKDLIGRGGVNGRVAVTNQTMGGDPAVGKDKSLRVFAINKRGQEREFDYNEGSFVEVRWFTIRQEGWDDRGTNYGGGREREDGNDLRIIRAYYGVQGRTVDVADILRSRVREGALRLMVTNDALGGDPAIGVDKILIVVYQHQGRETATAVREGLTLAIP
jgi:hypothetical protein